MLRWLAEVWAWFFEHDDSMLDEEILVYREERGLDRVEVEELRERKVA